MRLMSFSLTTPQFRARRKRVTRRLGWLHAKVGDVVCGVEKGQGLKKGEHVVRLGPVRFVSVRREPLVRMWRDEAYGWREVVMEGFQDMTPVEFVNMFAQHNRCEVDEPVTRIEFEYFVSVTRTLDNPAGMMTVDIDREDMPHQREQYRFDVGESLWMPERSALVIAEDLELSRYFVIHQPINL